jgi:hypothetical protein
MSHKKEQRPPPDELVERQELAKAHALLQDPAQVEAVDTQNFGRRLSEILMQALRRGRGKMKR